MFYPNKNSITYEGSDPIFLSLMRYVESNALRAGAVERSADWPWSSLAIRLGDEKPIVLSKGPMALPGRWAKLVDKAVNMPEKDCKMLETCIKRGRPMGRDDWIMRTAAMLELESTLRPRRPKNGV